MTRRSVFLTFGAGWAALVLMRVAVNLAGMSSKSTVAGVASVVVAVALFWVPVIPIVAWINRAQWATRTSVLVATHIAFSLIAAALEPAWVRVVLMWLADMARDYSALFVGRSDTNFLLYGVIVAADIALLRLDAFREREVAAARLEQMLTDTQLHALAIQLQPHFLFNALQFVAETAHDDLAAARRTLRLLRGLVEQAFALESRVEVTVAEELSFLRAYGEIQRSRFGERFSLSIDADEFSMGAGIPPLLLQPLVENASRHGFAKRGSGGHIEVAVRGRNGVLSIVVADDGIGFPAHVVEGQGLSVTRRRLARLHGGQSHLSLARAGDGRTEVRIRLPLRTPQPAEVAPVLDTASGRADSEPASSADRFIQRVPFAARVLGVWVALLTLVISATYVAITFGEYWPSAASGLKALWLDEMVGLPFWIVLTVAAVTAARRVSGRWAIPIHALLAGLITLAHVSLGDIIAARVFGVDSPEPRYIPWATWDMLVYVAFVSMAHAHDLHAWARDKMREAVSLNEQVKLATSRLNRLREMQSSLLNELDDVIASPTMETLDRSVVDFADFLRSEVMADVNVPAGATS